MVGREQEVVVVGTQCGDGKLAKHVRMCEGFMFEGKSVVDSALWSVCECACEEQC